MGEGEKPLRAERGVRCFLNYSTRSLAPATLNQSRSIFIEFVAPHIYLKKREIRSALEVSFNDAAGLQFSDLDHIATLQG